jgi:hypothetical protein
MSKQMNKQDVGYNNKQILETQTTLQMMFMAQSGAQCKVLVLANNNSNSSDDSALLKLELIDRFDIKISFKMSQR